MAEVAVGMENGGRRTATNQNAIPTTSCAIWREPGKQANLGRLVVGQ